MYDNERNSYSNGKLFEINGITNRDIGHKIKSFSKFFLKFTIFLYAVCAFIMFFYCASFAEYGGIFVYIIILVSLGIGFVMSYYGFLIMSGFGALVEDVNTLKVLTRNSSTTATKEKYDELPKL